MTNAHSHSHAHASSHAHAVATPTPGCVDRHDFLGEDHDANARRTLWVVWLTAITMVGEIAAGYITGSMALLADGFHMATHAGVLAVSAAAYSYARRHAANPRFSFGTGKVGDLAGFASALVLAIFSLGIGVESAIRLARPIPVEFGPAIIVAVIGLLVNLASALLLSGGHGHSHGHDHGLDHHDHDHGHSHGHDNNLRSAYMHVLADALTSVLAIGALIAGLLGGWTWLDAVAGIVGAVVIARWAMGLLKDTSAILLDSTSEHLVAQIRAAVADHDAQVSDLHVWKIGPQAHAAIISVTGAGDIEALRARLEPMPELKHVTVEQR